MNKKNSIKGAGSILIATFLYGFFGVLTRVVGDKIPVFYGSAIRGLVGGFLLFLFLFFFGSIKKISKKDYGWIVLRSFVGELSFVTSYIVFLHISFGVAYFIYYCGLLISGYIIGGFLYREKLTRVKIISLILAFIGISLIYSFNLKISDPTYMFLIFISGILATFWNTLSKKVSSDTSATQLNMLDFLFTAIICVIISLLIGEKWILLALDIHWFGSLLFLGMFMITGQLMIYGFRYLEVQIGSLILLMEILFGIIFGYLFFQQTVSLVTLVGGLLIITAIILPEVKMKK